MLGVVSVWSGGLADARDGRSWWEQDADVPAYAASLVTVPLATAAEALDLERRVPVRARFDSVVPGRTFELDRDDDQDDATWDALGGAETLGELRRRAVAVSSNIASALLLDEVGVPAVQDVLRSAGTSARTTFARGIGDAPARREGLTNEVTARDLARLLARTPPAVEELMRQQAYRDGIPAGLPAGVAVANKTGWVDGVAHDVAIVRPTSEQGGEPFVLAVLTTGDEPLEDAERRIAAVAAEAWERRR